MCNNWFSGVRQTKAPNFVLSTNFHHSQVQVTDMKSLKAGWAEACTTSCREPGCDPLTDLMTPWKVMAHSFKTTALESRQPNSQQFTGSWEGPGGTGRDVLGVTRSQGTGGRTLTWGHL